MSPDNSDIPLDKQSVAHPTDYGDDTDDYYDKNDSFGQHDFHPNKPPHSDLVAGQDMEDASDGYGPFVPTLGRMHNLM